MEDNEIIQLFQSRSEQAITELSKKYGAICARLSNNILKNRLDAEECVNDAYLGVWNSVPPQNPDPLLTYVCRIVRNLSLKKYHSNTTAKRNGFYDAALDELEDCIASGQTIEKELSAKELSRLLDLFLGTLDKTSRIMFVRRYWYSDSVSDIAEKLHMSNNSVSVRLSRTRTRLRKYLRKEGIIP